MFVSASGFSCRAVALGCGLCPVYSLCCFAAVCVVVVFVCVFFQCFSSFSHLCSCVGQALFGHIKIVSVTAFFLMKNVLRHGREKDVGALQTW